jgi:hypothetical protein
VLRSCVTERLFGIKKELLIASHEQRDGARMGPMQPCLYVLSYVIALPSYIGGYQNVLDAKSRNHS